MTSAKGILHDARVLIVEDDYYLATDLQDALEAAGASVIGPFANTADAIDGLAHAVANCAFVDLNLGAGPSFNVPRALADRAIPFVFVTGYDAETILDEFAHVRRLEKPVEARRTIEAAVRMLKRD